MTQEAVDSINSDTVVKFEAANDLVVDTYFKFAVGLAAVIAMIVYPVIFQFYGFGSEDGNINWFPTASMVAVAMGAVLVFAGIQRFKSDRKNMEALKKRTTENLKKMASTASKFSNEKTIVVDDSGKMPRLVLQERTLIGNLLD
jgi:hypothetical protein